MKIWEYATIHITMTAKAVVEYTDGREEKYDSALKALKAMGEQGWEFCGVTQGVIIYLKRSSS